MNSIVWSFIEVNLLIAICYCTYFLVKNSLSLKLRRLLLISIPILATSFILLKNNVDLGAVSYSMNLIELEPVVVNASGEQLAVNTDYAAYSTAYLAIIAALILVLVIRLSSVLWFFGRNRSTKLEGFRIYEVPGKDSFSFFHLIHLKPDLSGDDRQIVFDHEKVHAKQWHSLDIIIMEIYHLICWINPIFFWVKRELISLHEFQVDAIMYKRYQVNYMRFLINYALGFQSPNYLFTSRFYNRLTIKKRIQSMKTNRKQRWWLAALIPLIGVSAMFVQCTKTDQKEEVKEEKVFDVVDEQPEYVGGHSAMVDYIVENVRYPEKAKAAEAEGTVYVEFVIASDGSITRAKVLKSVHELLDKEALRIVEAMPNWNPGIHEGKKVAVKFVLPIKFQLN